MSARTRIRRSLQVALLVLAGPIALAQEQALVFGANDAGIKWGPCPDPLPKGCGLFVLHGDPAKPNTDVFLRLPGGSTIPLHVHTSAERMVLVAGALNVTYEGQDMAMLTPGSYAYGPAGKPHSAVCVSRQACVLFIAFEAPVDIKAVTKGK